MNTKFASKDTTFMSALVVTGALLTAMTPFIADQNLAAQRAATAVVEAARGLAQTATSVTPAAMQPRMLTDIIRDSTPPTPDPVFARFAVRTTRLIWRPQW